MTRHADVAASSEVKAAIPALADLAAGIGDRQVRARGTLGALWPTTTLPPATPARCWAWGYGHHQSARDCGRRFFVGMYTTALDEGEIITAIRFPIPKRAAYMKFKQPASRFSLVGVFVAQFDAGVRVAVTGLRAACSATRAGNRAIGQLHPRPPQRWRLTPVT